MENIGTTAELSNEITLGLAIKKAFIAWLKIFLYFIILPFKIWKASTMRLAENSDTAIIKDDEEFPMYTFSKVSMDSTIFIFGIISIPLAFVGVGFGIYFFLIPMLSFIKEVFTISLITVTKLDVIAKNTSK